MRHQLSENKDQLAEFYAGDSFDESTPEGFFNFNDPDEMFSSERSFYDATSIVLWPSRSIFGH